MNPRGAAGLLLGLMGAVSCAPSLGPPPGPGDIRSGAVWRDADRPPLSPDEALASFVLEPGYRIDVVAAEPLVRDPVAIAFDERGRMYVAENRGYPDPLDGADAAKPEGVVALLTDTTGDGRYDTRTDFAVGLTYPNGIMVWNGGVFVTCAPDLLYLRDTTGDGIADERRVVLTGFHATRTAQIRFSHPTLGLDNWMYLTSGLNGGRITVPARLDRPPVEFVSSDSRFNPRTLEFELAGGQGQYGLTFDDHGRRFICANRHPAWHVVMEPRHLQRNPHLAFSDTVQEVSAAGAQAAVWPISRDLTTASFHPELMSTPHAGTFTSASGVHIHRGDALPEGGRDSLFICESAQNLVQRQVRESSGVSFRSRPARQGAEFLASPDTWFSPVFAANGPDGALYIVDMYRKDIDHPQYVPAPSRRLFDFTAGRERGRIYRVAAAGRPPGGPAFDLGRAPLDELVPALAHRNAWWRETAQRLLVERQSRDAVPRLRALARSHDELGRLHALWTLDGLGALTEADGERALRDGQAGVRENGVRLAEGRLAASPALLDAVLALQEDEDPRVRLRVALALGDADDPRAMEGLASIARRDGADRWVRAAVLSGIANRSSAFLEAFAAVPPASPVVRAAVMQDLGQLFGAAETVERCLAFISDVADPEAALSWQPAALSGIAQGLRVRGMAGESRSALMSVLSSETPGAIAARRRLEALMARAAAMALSDDAPEDLRLPAIELLGQGHWAGSGDSLVRLLEPRQPAVLQVAAVRALGQLREPAAAASLVEARRWRAYAPQMRDAVLTTLLSESRHVHVLLDAIQRQDVSASAIGPSRRTRLKAHRDESIQQRARELFAALETGDRMQVYDRARRDVLARTGNFAAGARLYTAHCAACHTFRAEGGRLGPDLSGISNQPADTILLHILVPDYEITPRYETYMVETRDGRSLLGRLESETPNSLTLRDASSQHVVLRTDVASISAVTASLMPGSLEQTLSAQEMADLLAYLKSRSRR